MKFKDLKEFDFDYIRTTYKNSISKAHAQNILSDKYNVHKRTIRKWASKLEINRRKNNINNPSKILIYDIETCQVPAMVWWSGKQFVSGNRLLEEPKIITICYKWLNESKIHYLTWDKNQCDKQMVTEFLKVYNKADLVVGQNNNRFDNKWVNTRAMKHGLDVNTHVRSFDIMRETKRLFKLPSYSMKYIADYLGVQNKMQHEGIVMWDKIQRGTKSEQKEYLNKMIEYNKQDIVVTEEMFLRLRKYLGNYIHVGVLNGHKKYTCPNCGTTNVSLYKTTVTPSGTIQRIMKCNVDGVKYKITNKQYMSFLDFKIKNK